MKKSILFFIFLFSTLFLIAQEEKEQKAILNWLNRFQLGVEMGTNPLRGSLRDNWSVKQAISGHNNDYGSIYTATRTNLFGIKAEYLFLNYKLGLTTGLRLSFLDTDLSKDSYYNSYFDLKYEHDEAAGVTRYARVESISERNIYLGIPLEIRYVPFQWQVIGLYVKAGTEIGFLLHDETSIEFVDKEMKAYHYHVLDKIGRISPNSFYSRFYSALGIRIGKPNHVNCSVDLLLPSFFLTEDNSSLIKIKYFSGIQLSVQLPLKLN